MFNTVESLVVSEPERFLIRRLVCLLWQHFILSAPLVSYSHLVRDAFGFFFFCHCPVFTGRKSTLLCAHQPHFVSFKTAFTIVCYSLYSKYVLLYLPPSPPHFSCSSIPGVIFSLLFLSSLPLHSHPSLFSSVNRGNLSPCS